MANKRCWEVLSVNPVWKWLNHKLISAIVVSEPEWRRFKIRDEYVAFLEKIRWGGNIECIRCGKDRPYKIQNNKDRWWKCRECHYRFNVFIGTVFQQKKLTPDKLFSIIYDVRVLKNYTTYGIGKKYNISQVSAWNFVRELKMGEEKEEVAGWRAVVSLRKGFTESEMTSELIELKRAQLLLNETLNGKRNRTLEPGYKNKMLKRKTDREKRKNNLIR